MTVHYYEVTKLPSTLYYRDTCNITMFEQYILVGHEQMFGIRMFVRYIKHSNSNLPFG